MKSLLLFFVACAAQPVAQTPVVHELGHAPRDPWCDVRVCLAAGDDPCCELARTDTTLFREQCGVAGACADYECPTTNGGAVMIEVCR